MKNPDDIGLPFFAYGIFRPSQLGYHRLKNLVEEVRQDCTIAGTLMIRDGLPIADPQGDGIYGSLLTFKPGLEADAYCRIAEIEPDKQYRWGVSTSNGIKVNVLFGRSPQKGSVPFEGGTWDGRKDPLFTEAIAVIQETLLENTSFDDWDMRPLFRLQMAYLLLWSVIERYVSLRYHLGDKVMEKINNIANEKAFSDSLRKHVRNTRPIYRADKPDEKVTLNPNSPEASLRYYYQIRSNITHRGKGVFRDYEIMQASLRELLSIFEDVLQKGFEDAEIDD